MKEGCVKRRTFARRNLRISVRRRARASVHSAVLFRLHSAESVPSFPERNREIRSVDWLPRASILESVLTRVCLPHAAIVERPRYSEKTVDRDRRSNRGDRDGAGSGYGGGGEKGGGGGGSEPLQARGALEGGCGGAVV